MRPKKNEQVNESAWSRWYLVKDRNRKGETVYKIRRYRFEADKTVWDRYPSEHYAGQSESQIQALLRRLNATHEIDRKHAEDRYNFDHAFINLHSMSKFEKNLDLKITDENAKKTIIQFLNEYVFEFFVIQSKMPDPSRWHLKEDEWGQWLLEKDMSAATLKKIVSTANRFNKYLVDKVYPEMATPRKLEPFGKRLLDNHESRRGKHQKIKTKFIKPEVWQQILTAAANSKTGHPEVIPNMKLCYAFGFRISETLGLTKDKFLKDSVLVDEQGEKVIETEDGKKAVSRKKVKTSERRVPYWNMTAKEAWQLVQQITPMHPDTLNRRVNEIMGKFGHSSHDFRRTFITNSFRKSHWKDVMKAAGHSDVRTTMAYDQDDRNLSDEKADLD